MAHENNEFIDYYQLLRVSSDASTDQIKKAYKKRALEKHPDRNPNNPNAGAEFAILVEAKEILSDKESRKKYNDKYKIYERRLQRRQQEKIENDKRSHQRKEDIIRLENAEQRAKEKNRHDFYTNYIHKTKKNAVKEELDKFRKLIQEQQETELSEKINKLKEEKLKKKSLIVKLDKKRCNKPYTKNELETIFKIYGKIIEINMITNGAEIVFAKSKYVLKALNDEETLQNTFYLTLIVYDKNKKTKIKKPKKINQEEKWREFIKQRQNLNHQQYQQLVWDKVEQFIVKHKNKNDMHTGMDVDC